MDKIDWFELVIFRAQQQLPKEGIVNSPIFLSAATQAAYENAVTELLPVLKKELK